MSLEIGVDVLPSSVEGLKKFWWKNPCEDSCEIVHSENNIQELADCHQKFERPIYYESLPVQDDDDMIQIIVLKCRLTGDEHRFRYCGNRIN